jgi:hypothetical protein
MGVAIANSIPAANTTAAGTVKVGNNLSVNATGFLESTYFNPSIASLVTISNTSTFTANSSVDIIFGDTNAAGANINVILPLNAAEGKTYTVKNTGNNSVVVYSTTAGRVETPNWGTFGNGYTISSLGDAESWVFNSGYYRHVGSKRTPATGPYADDTAAAAAGIRLYQSYYDASGFLKIRLT